MSINSAVLKKNFNFGKAYKQYIQCLGCKLIENRYQYGKKPNSKYLEIYQKPMVTGGYYVAFAAFYALGIHAVLLIATLIFIEGLLIGSLITLRNKRTMMIAMAIYVVLGLLFALIL